MEDDLQAGEYCPLEPLVLPPGVTPDIAARLTTGILMRQAYCSTTPWTQWLLLASVRILHGHGTPTLDSVSLHLLQGSLDEKLSCGDLSVDVEDAIPHLSTEEIKEKTNNFEKGNTASPCTKDHTVRNVDLENTLNEEPSPAMKNAAEEEREKLSYLEEEKFADNTTIPFIGNCIGAHTGLESAVNVDKSHLEASCYSVQNIVSEDKKILEISFNPSKRSTPRTSLVPFPKNYLCENDNSFHVSHHSPKDSNISNIADNQQRSSVSLEGDKILEKHCPDKEPNSIVMSQDHHKTHGPPEGNVPTELSNISKKHNLLNDIMSAETDNAPCNSASTLIKKSVSIQVNPRKLGILTTKWVQVKGPRLTEVGVQADPSTCETKQTKSFEVQLGISGCADTLKVFADKEMQTVIQNKRDKSSQTGEVNLKIESQPSQPLWNIISLSDLPNRKKNSASEKKDQTKSVAGDNEKNALNIGFESSNAEKSVAKGKKLFHGRPMAKGKMTKPVEIPLDAVARMQDPRIQG